MNIRHATPDDYTRCMVMGQNFWSATIYPVLYDADYVLTHIKAAAAAGLLLVLEVEDKVVGMVAGVIFPLLANRQCLQATELAFWIEPEHRGRYGVYLVKEFEKAARRAGADYLNMISLESAEPEIASRIYKKMGFEKVETTWTKRLIR